MRHWGIERFQQINCPSVDVAAFAGRQVEGFLDVAHFGFVHTGTFGDPDNLEVPDYSPTPTDYGFEVDYRSTVGNYPHGGKAGEPGFDWLSHFEAFVPFTAPIARTGPSSKSRNPKTFPSTRDWRSTFPPSVGPGARGTGCAVDVW
ncbi:hypothetical protein [Rhodococcus koreensis]